MLKIRSPAKLRTEVSENEWLNLAIKGGAFDFLKDAAEDIYTMEDGISYKTEKWNLK